MNRPSNIADPVDIPPCGPCCALSGSSRADRDELHQHEQRHDPGPQRGPRSVPRCAGRHVSLSHSLPPLSSHQAIGGHEAKASGRIAPIIPRSGEDQRSRDVEEVRVARTAIIGLDGATFRLLDLLCDAGVMPSLATLRARGVDGVLRSTTPAYTPTCLGVHAHRRQPGPSQRVRIPLVDPQEPVKIAHAGRSRPRQSGASRTSARPGSASTTFR